LKTPLLKPEEYLVFKDKGIDIAACEIDFKILCVRCEDLSLYRKAFRVKIRALLKVGDINKLKDYVNALYSLASFAKYLYGFHSCASNVEPWQEELALYLQVNFDKSRVEAYNGNTWITYTGMGYVQALTKKYKDLTHSAKLDTSVCVQDTKPFLNLKDKAHFEKCFQS